MRFPVIALPEQRQTIGHALILRQLPQQVHEFTVSPIHSNSPYSVRSSPVTIRSRAPRRRPPLHWYLIPTRAGYLSYCRTPAHRSTKPVRLSGLRCSKASQHLHVQPQFLVLLCFAGRRRVIEQVLHFEQVLVTAEVRNR